MDRNLGGGSIGVSLANTELMQRAQFHQSRLVEAAVPSSLSYQNTLERVTEFFISQGSPLVKAQGQAVGWIGHTIVSQATLLSYIDVFWSFSIFALIMVPLALTLKHVELSRHPVRNDWNDNCSSIRWLCGFAESKRSVAESSSYAA